MKVFPIILFSLISIKLVSAQASLVKFTPCPVKNWECWIANGEGFRKFKWIQDVRFDPAVAMPDAENFAYVNAPISATELWEATPKSFKTSRQTLAKCGTHTLDEISYSLDGLTNRPPDKVTYVYLWDNRPFCVAGGDFAEGDANFAPMYYLRRSVQNTSGDRQLKVAICWTGTGAICFAGYFDLNGDRPKMIRTTESGKNEDEHSIPVKKISQ